VKRIVAACFLLAMMAMMMPVHASVTMKVTMDQNIMVVFDFEDMDPSTYYQVKPLLNATAIAQAILKNLEEQNLTNTRSEYGAEPERFDDATLSIHVEFYLAGSDIISFGFDRATMNRVYSVRTGWRKFHLNLTDEFSLDFTKLLGEPMSKWQKTNYTDTESKARQAYYYSYADEDSSGVSCYFILPTAATKVRVYGDTVTFEIPPAPEDALINSPILILSGLLILNIIFAIRRRLME